MTLESEAQIFSRSARRWLQAAILVTAMPFCVLSGYFFFPLISFEVRIGVQIYAFALSYPAILVGLFLAGRNPALSVPVLLSGSFLRLGGLFLLGFLLRFLDSIPVVETLLLYLATVLIFLIFEVVSFVPFGFSAVKRVDL